jgi:hypothetical protein
MAQRPMSHPMTLLRVSVFLHPMRQKERLPLSRHNAAAAVRWFRAAEADPIENRDELFGLLNACSILGDKAAATALLEKARCLDRLYRVIERAR